MSGWTGLLTLALLWQTQAAVEPDAARAKQPVFPSRVEMISVDAVVVDAHGHPVPDLTRDDFVILEDGQPQDIAAFEVFSVSNPGGRQSPGSEVVATNMGSESHAVRAVALVVDDLGIPPEEAKRVADAVARFIDASLTDGDRVLLTFTSGAPPWSTRLPQGKDDLLMVLRRLRGLAQSRGVDPLLDVLSTLRRASAALRSLRGSKSMMLFSPGFIEDVGPDGDRRVRDLVAELRDANTPVHFVDIQGLLATPTGLGAWEAGTPDPNQLGASLGFTPKPVGPPQRGRPVTREGSFPKTSQGVPSSSLEASQGARHLAEDTGGRVVRNTNDFGGGAIRVADESRIFYLLGFYPPAGKKTEVWRDLSVRVKRPGLVVRARRGYRLRDATRDQDKAGNEKTDGGPSRVAVGALESLADLPGIPLRAMAYLREPRPGNRTRLLVAVELDGRRLKYEPAPGGRVARLEVAILVADRDSPSALRGNQRMEVRLRGEEAPGWRSLTQEFDVPPGVSQVKVFVQDTVSREIGTVTQRVEIPASSGLRLSTPLVTERLDRERGRRPNAVLAVHRVFPPRGQLFCQFEVFGAVPDAAAKPRVSAGFVLRSADGSTVREAPPTAIAADPDGRLVRLVGFDAGDLREGPYDLVIAVRDDVTGAHLEQHEALTLASEAQGSGQEPTPPPRGQHDKEDQDYWVSRPSSHSHRATRLSHRSSSGASVVATP
jgi:VWFA-related protein